MDSKYIFTDWEARLADIWENKHYFEAQITKGNKPFSIVLPPPNANGDLHVGHAMFVYEDILIRYHKMKGFNTMWLLGLDHAGIETQYVFEKHLKKQGKSRFNYDRQTLYKMIWDFVQGNKHTIISQLKRLGFGLDYTREVYTMDPKIVKIVYRTFKHLFEKKLVYRANRLVNYCTHCGTSFSDLEIKEKEVQGKLYHITYQVQGGGEIVVATTRPETLFGDEAVMVHPEDKRYKEFIGKKAILPLVGRKIPILEDASVDMKFGTGAVKVTPNHDFADWDVAERHHLPHRTIINFEGKMINTGLVDELYVKKGREETIRLLKESGALKKENEHVMTVKLCYRCGMTLEPLPNEQWFVSVKSLTQKAIKKIEKGEIKVFPHSFTKQLIRILENFIDWNVSRQIVWGIRIPAYQCAKNNEWFVSEENPEKCLVCGSCKFSQDKDTFDTWFSSSQWPFATFQSLSSKEEDLFGTFYPTSAIETGYEILRAWVARMMMIGLFETDKIPFNKVFLHGMVRDKQGMKMSKSRGNVINPLIMIDKYGADALRASLIFSAKEGGDLVLSEDKIVGMRNFANKIWNIGRFLEMNAKSGAEGTENLKKAGLDNEYLKELEKELKLITKKYHGYFDKMLPVKAFDLIYDFIWHRLADYYIEKLKDEMKDGNIEAYKGLENAYIECLKMLHPYMPFVTDAIYISRSGRDKSIIELRFTD